MVGSLLRFPPSQRPFPFFIMTTLGGDHSLRSQPRASLTACIVMSLFLQFGDWSRRLLALQGVQMKTFHLCRGTVRRKALLRIVSRVPYAAISTGRPPVFAAQLRAVGIRKPSQ
jgi:hypothetical protein